jgi:hypothetical protein
MRRGSRAPSMMFQIEAAAAIIAEAEATMLRHETSISNERCETNYIRNCTNDIEPATEITVRTDRSCHRSPSCTTLLSMQLHQSVNLP